MKVTSSLEASLACENNLKNETNNACRTLFQT